MADKVTAANKKIAKASSKMAAGPIGAKMMEMMDVPSFARGLTPQILIDLGVKKITLLTSSSKNIVGIDGFGIEINGTKKFS